jgi:hypothetical protein
MTNVIWGDHETGCLQSLILDLGIFGPCRQLEINDGTA